MNGYPKKFIDNAMKTRKHVRKKTEYQSSVSLPYIGSASHKIERIFKEAFNYTILVKTNCFDLSAHKRIALTNFRNPVCTAFHVNVVWYILVKLAEISHYVLKNNCEKAELEKSAVAKHSWTNDHRIKWNETSILATESHKFSRKMRE